MKNPRVQGTAAETLRPALPGWIMSGPAEQPPQICPTPYGVSAWRLQPQKFVWAIPVGVMGRELCGTRCI
jgi:hypothetical protein